jgi:hypothetical protein
VKGKPWTPKQEKELRRLVRVKEGLDVVPSSWTRARRQFVRRLRDLG